MKCSQMCSEHVKRKDYEIFQHITAVAVSTVSVTNVLSPVDRQHFKETPSFSHPFLRERS